ncbi:MAG: class I SAM-dependent methyltransferase [archaeon]|jgi:hypothetical protein
MCAIHLGPATKREIQVGRNFVFSQKQQQAFEEMLKKMPKRKPKFMVFEGGCSPFPYALVEKALKAEKSPHLKHREFLGVDKESVDLNATLMRIGGKKPRSLKVQQADIFRALESLKPNSQHVIFSSYLINNLGAGLDAYARLQLQTEFLKKCKDALVPGGRIIVIDNKQGLANHKIYADHLGLELHTIEMKDSQAMNSPHEAIRDRSNPMLRQWMFENAVNKKGLAQAQIQSFIDMGIVKEPAEMFTPIIYIFKKRRPYYVGPSGASTTSKSLVKARK